MELGIQLDLKFHAIVYFAGKPGGRSLKHVGTATVESRERINDACYPANSPCLEHQDRTPGNRVAYSGQDLPTSGKELRQFLIDVPTEQQT